MKKIFLTFILTIFLIISVNALSVQPPSIDIDYALGEEQPESIEITFSNLENTTVSVTLTEEGNTSNFITESLTSFSLINVSTQKVIVSFNIPPTTSPKLYSGKIRYSDTYIPVYINVRPIQTIGQCRIISTFPEYSMSIKKGSPSFQNSYNFKVSKYCTEGIDITDIYPSGQITMTTNGYAPIRITGGIPKGFKESDESFLITLEFDSEELGLGTYISYLIVGGVGGDETVTSSIKFVINIVGEATPVGDIIIPPIFDPIPTDLMLNQSYILVARSVNPNIDMKVDISEIGYIKGDYTEKADSTWKWHFTPLKPGNVKIKMWAEYLGGLIGEVQEREIKITSTIPVVGGIVIVPQFFQQGIEKKAEELNPGTVVIMAIDNKTGNLIVPFNLYVNGILINKTSLELEQDKIYNIRIDAVGYNNLVISNITTKQLQTSFTIEPNSEFYLIGDKINLTSPENCSFLINGYIINTMPYELLSIGTTSIECTKLGYISSNKTIDVRTSVTYVTMSPLFDDWKKGKKILVELNKNVSWNVYLTKEGATERILKSTGEGNLVEFKIDDLGYWEITSEAISILGKNITKSSFNINWKFWEWKYYFGWILVGAIIIVVIYILIKRMGGAPSEGAKFTFGGAK